MKRTPPFFKRLLIFSISLITVCILLFSFITYRRISRDLNSLSRQMMLNQVLSVENSYTSLVDEMSGRLNSLMTMIKREAIDGERVREVLDSMMASFPEYRHIWIIRQNGELLSDSGTNGEYLSRTDWWKEFRNRAANDGNPDYQGQYVVAPFPGVPYKDAMGLNTILPVSFLLLSSINTAGVAFTEMDITMVLQRTKLISELLSGTNSYPIDISLYDKSGRLLETSGNLFPGAAEDPPDGNVPLLVPFDDLRYSSGAVFVQGEERVTVYSRNTTLGLIFAGSLPKDAINSNARRAALYILVIGVFCLLSVLGLGLLLLGTYNRMKHYEKEQASARFQSLQNKMNPHFLFNTLDSLVGVAETRDFTMLISMLRHLSYILHMNLRITRDIIPLSDEIRYIESYVALQKIRYKEGFSFELKLPESCDDLEILRFCLQPVVENCFVHGVSLHRGFVAVKMALERRDNYLCCDVTNTCSSASAETLDKLRAQLTGDGQGTKENRLGLFSIHKRLRILYGDEYGIELPPQRDVFHVRIYMPVLC